MTTAKSMFPPWGPWAGRLLTIGSGGRVRVGVLARRTCIVAEGVGAKVAVAASVWEVGLGAGVSVAGGVDVGAGAGVALAPISAVTAAADGTAVTTTVITWGVSA